MILRILRGSLGEVGTYIAADAEAGNLLISSGSAELVDASNIKSVEAELTRPANTTGYTAGDHVANATSNVKQKETLTLAGVFGTATISCGGVSKVATFASNTTITAAAFVSANSASYLSAGIVLTSLGADLIFEANVAGVPFTAPTISYVTSDVAGSVTHTTANVTAVKQKETITLAGSYGTCNITGTGGLTKLVTFHTSTTVTASDFVTAFEDDYLDEGIVVTSSGADLIFEAEVAGTPFTAPTIDGVAGDLAGTVAHTTANRAAVAQVDTVTFSGTSGIAHVAEVGGLTKDIAFVSTLKDMCDQFVVDHATAYDDEDITVTAGAVNTLIFTAKVAGIPLVLPVVVGETGDLAGTAAVTTANVTAVAKVETITVTGGSGYATVGAAGGLTKQIEFNTDIATSIDNFITTNSTLYLAQGIVLSRDGVKLVLTANVAGTTFTAPTIANISGVRGTVAHTTANVVAVAQVETITATGTAGQATVAAAGSLTKIVTFDTTWQKTWDDFVAANQSLYEAQNIHLYSQGNVLTMTAVEAGTSFTAPTITNRVNLSGTVAHATANITISPITISNLFYTNVGCMVGSINAVSNMTNLSGLTVRLWCFSAIPDSVPADNAVLTQIYSNNDVFLFSADLTFNTLTVGSDSVYASRNLFFPVKPTSGNLYVMIQTLSDFTPTSEGKISLTANSIIV